MRIAVAHSRYRWPGGEDVVFEAEVELLRSRGHEVFTITAKSEVPPAWDLAGRAALATSAFWSPTWYRRTREFLRGCRPDVFHVHNWFPAMSPSIFHAARREGVPIVQTLHNPRLLCPAATLHRLGQTCVECLGRRFALPGVRHGCYHGSRFQTFVVASMIASHRAAGTFNLVDRFITPTEFFKDLYERGEGLGGRIAVKPHFVMNDPGERTESGEYALYVGRLDAEKGIPTLLRAWRSGMGLPLKIRGEGPLEDEVRRCAAELGPGRLELIPRLPREELTTLLKQARFLVWPSEGYYETFGLVTIEAYACGVPVLAARTGVAVEMVEPGPTGRFFEPGDSRSLASAAEWAVAHPDELARMGRAARQLFEERFTAPRNHDLLVEIYGRTILDAAPRRVG